MSNTVGPAPTPIMGLLSRVSTRGLALGALAGGLGVLAFGQYVQTQIVVRQAAAGFYQDAVKVARRDQGVRHLMGANLIDRKYDPFDQEKNRVTPESARLSVPVKGDSGNGVLIIRATRERHDHNQHQQQHVQDPDELELVLRKCELEVLQTKSLLPKDFRNKRLVVFDEDRHGPIKQYLKENEEKD